MRSELDNKVLPGRGVNSGTFIQYASATISQVSTLPTALTATQVNALYNHS